MTEYHKIETLFERDRETFTVYPDKIKWPVIKTIKHWDVTEKIDGTNIRIMLIDDNLTFGGRTAKAEMPAPLLESLINTFKKEKLRTIFSRDVILYGEGYGGKIQKGSAYRANQAFILFDVLVDNKWWLDRKDVEDIAAKLGIDCVPYLGQMTLEEIIELVQKPFASKIGTAIAEGVIGRPIETLYDKNGKRIIIKLKTKDFAGGSRK